MKWKTWEAILAMFTLSACASNATGRESWGKSTFSPSPTTERFACNAGFRYGKILKQFPNVGLISFRTPKGIVGFSTKLGEIYKFCSMGAYLFDQNTNSNFSEQFNYVFIDGVDLIKDLKSVDILLLDDKKNELRKLKTRIIESEVDVRTYGVADFTEEEIAAMDKTASFVIILDNGSLKTRYEVDQRMQPYGQAVYTSSSTSHPLEQSKSLTHRAIVEGK